MSTLYQPVIVRKEVDDEHYYFVDDKFYPSVTQILDVALPKGYGLLQYYGNLGVEKAEEERDKAGDRGSRIHKACETLLYGKPVKLKDFPRKDAAVIVAFTNWLTIFQTKVIGIEMILASSMGYAGTLDLYCQIDPKIIYEQTKLKTENPNWIIDLKTSKSIHDAHKLQQVAYKGAFKEMYDIDVNNGILHLNATKQGWSFVVEMLGKGRYQFTEKDWRLVMAMFKMLNGGVMPEPPMVNVYPDELKLSDKEREDIISGTKLLVSGN